MRRPRAKKPKKAKSRRAAGDSAVPVVFRLEGLLLVARTEKPSLAVDPGPARVHAMATLLADVTPLDGAARVARLRERHGVAAGAAHTARKALEFVLERDGDRVDGHRADLAPPRVAPGRGRTWVPEVRLDLHGVRARDLDAHLSRALRDCVRRVARRLLVIHGKGLHSVGGESVLAEAVLERLAAERHAKYVRAFSTAPERLGGSGALAVEIDV